MIHRQSQGAPNASGVPGIELKVKTHEVFKFKKGQKLTLDEIYSIQGLANGDWWEACDPFDKGDSVEMVTITKDITIEIRVTRQ